MSVRLVLLVSTPRVAPGLLTREAWSTLEGAYAVWARPDEPQAAAVVEAGIEVDTKESADPAVLARDLVAATGSGDVVWIGSVDGDPGLNEAIAVEVSRLPEPPDVELLIGSFDVPGARLLDVVAVMDRLRSPGGCPWDAEQTHESLVPYLLEESHETIEAIESGDPVHMQEELGDLLLQIAFQARVAEEHPVEPFGIDDVAGGLVDKLVRRHPHVFADVDASTPAEVEANWETIKAEEKQHRSHPLEGIPLSLPALARAHKAIGRLEKAGRSDLVDEALAAEGLGAELLAVVRRARSAGIDAEAALRETLRALDGTAGPTTD
ncbi:nucleoside triphosphate hydrolase [Intrasporangium oryzae NRRL B-24470]|uniref:Nucleoside triphosphate hydrolase n=1 Tax=Intrasporangium oryzae NRRL B-24470 TaxID=1386089 RepID=W9G9V2_9MICO|nr:MazG family protein [Intrasporangium oryzae]EWT01598.1 nucleoside triphosphate hydrolase [Intrasporangium oryzae NRRL B-24470]